MATNILFKCEYCQHGFKTESGFSKHKCDAMQRENDFHSINGQVAWDYYKRWMVAKHRNNPSNSDTFKQSKYFNSFLKFVRFSKKVNLPDVNAFISLMANDNIDPLLWESNQAYKKYLEFITRKLPAKELIKITVKTLIDLSEAGDVKINEVFDILQPNEVIQLITQGRLSPWLLLHSRKFNEFLNQKTNKEERIIMETLINPNYWINRVKKHPKDAKIAKKYIRELEM